MSFDNGIDGVLESNQPALDSMETDPPCYYQLDTHIGGGTELSEVGIMPAKSNTLPRREIGKASNRAPHVSK